MKKIFIALLLFITVLNASAQSAKKPLGSLVIIGGGDRTEEIMKKLVESAELSPTDHIVILPMSSEEPDSAYYYVKKDLDLLTNHPIAYLNFTKQTTSNKQLVDSVKTAKLIFITGGDQSRFMNIVSGTPVYDAIHYAYEHGATVGGTSAGAAMMCEYMITGNQLRDSTYSATFYSIETNNIELTQGLGLIKNIIIDQHFVVRSRYNRLLTALQTHPNLVCTGIDESTALLIHGNTATVIGESQVVYFKNEGKIKVNKKNKISFEDLRIKIFVAGDSFKI